MLVERQQRTQQTTREERKLSAWTGSLCETNANQRSEDTLWTDLDLPNPARATPQGHRAAREDDDTVGNTLVSKKDILGMAVDLGVSEEKLRQSEKPTGRLKNLLAFCASMKSAFTFKSVLVHTRSAFDHEPAVGTVVA